MSEPKLNKRLFSIQSAEKLAKGIIEVNLKDLVANLKDKK